MTPLGNLTTISAMNSENKNGDQMDPEKLLSLGRTFRVENASRVIKKASSKKGFLTVIRSRADIGIHTFVEGRTVLGRNPDCDFPLRDRSVSWNHASIKSLGNGTYILQDLQSTNGTHINGLKLFTPYILRDGEKFFVGDTLVRFSLADEMDVDFHSEVAMLVGTDPLTGLESKRRFDESLEIALKTTQESSKPLAVLMMDMDGVKQINDTHGHLFGAHVIGETGRLIASVLGSQGRACRFGGDEFSAFMPGHDMESACSAAEQIRLAVENAGLEKEGVSLKPTISIGVASFPEAGRDLLQLISSADGALYRAKDLGKNRVAI